MRTGCLFLAFLIAGCVKPVVREPAEVRRTNPFVDDIADCNGDYSPAVSAEQTRVTEEKMGAAVERLNHFLWSMTRSKWREMSEVERQHIQKISREFGKHSPLCDFTGAAGEEFLLMYHMMNDRLHQAMRSHDPVLACIPGWKEYPQSIPVPDGMPGDASKSPLTERYLRSWFQQLSADEFLRTHTLNQLGFFIEYSFHNMMLMHLASPDGDNFDMPKLKFKILRPPTTGDAATNWLGNPFGAHVNPIFWQMHEWIDSLIVKWLFLHGKAEIAFSCEHRGSGCYEWRSHWIGAGLSLLDRMHTMGMRYAMSSEDFSNAEVTLEKYAESASFRNGKYDDFVAARKSNRPAASLMDPVEFVTKFGPCPGGD